MKSMRNSFLRSGLLQCSFPPKGGQLATGGLHGQRMHILRFIAGDAAGLRRPRLANQDELHPPILPTVLLIRVRHHRLRTATAENADAIIVHAHLHQ